MSIPHSILRLKLLFVRSPDIPFVDCRLLQNRALNFKLFLARRIILTKAVSDHQRAHSRALLDLIIDLCVIRSSISVHVINIDRALILQWLRCDARLAIVIRNFDKCLLLLSQSLILDLLFDFIRDVV